MAKITVRADSAYRKQIDPPRLRQAARQTLRHEEFKRAAEMTIAITGDDEIRALNQQYRGIDRPTDVLSFGQEPGSGPQAGEPGQPEYLGDIVISFPRAQAQATRGGHPVESELALLVVHGVLHLLGHDHAEPGEKRKMWAAQAEVLDGLGIPVRPGRR